MLSSCIHNHKHATKLDALTRPERPSAREGAPGAERYPAIVSGTKKPDRPTVAAHTFTLLGAEGNPVEERTRLAANVLLWEANGLNHRLETTGDLQSSLAIVETLEPIP